MNSAIPQDRHSPSESGVWLFVFADLCIFGLYFMVFAWDKSQFPAMFAAGQDSLNKAYGAVNTVLLLFSSYFVATAVNAARTEKAELFRRQFSLAILCGVTFVCVKSLEYSEKFQAGFHLASNSFYRDYFSFTGFHLLHVLFGLMLLTYVRISASAASGTRLKLQTIEGVGLYWHMVDLLWIILFSLIYLAP